MKRWLEETHGTRFELIRHFTPRFFDSELISTPGAWTNVAAGTAAVLMSGWIVLAFTLLAKYHKLSEMHFTAARIRSEMLADQDALAGIAVCLTLLLLGLIWQSIYPSLTDCLALAGMPVSAADLFASKFLSLVLVLAAFVVLMPLPSAAVLSMMSGVNFFEALLHISASCAIVFFGSIAVQGVLLQILPLSLFESAAIWMQAAFVAAGLGGLPYASRNGIPRVPDQWLAAAFLIPAALAFLAYAASYGRSRQLLLEAPRPRVGGGLLQQWDLFDALTHLCVKDPREQAALAFFWKTMRRSRIHRLTVLLYAGLASAWLMQSATNQLNNENEGAVFTVYPLVLMALALFGMRHLFALPVELRANWMFQLTERDCRAAWRNATSRFVLSCGVAPVTVVGAVLAGIHGGLWTGLAWAALAWMFGAAAFEHLFREWRKLPFTCSYLPGKRPLIVNIAIFACLSPLLFPVAWILYHAATNPASFLIVLTLEYALWALLRRARLRVWAIAPLRYEEAPESEVDLFQLNSDGTTLAQEEFQREWSDYLRTGGPAEPVIRPLAADETRSGRVWEWLSAMPRDLHFALRMLRKSPGFVLAVVLTLGLGLGLNSAFFTVFNAFLLRGLSVRDPASLASIELEARDRAAVHLTWPEYRLLAKYAPFQETAATTFIGTGLDGRAAAVNLVTANYFAMLGVSPAAGRLFVPEESDPVAVLSYRVWQDRYASDPAIIGRTITLEGKRFEVVGVASQTFTGVPVGAVELVPKKMARFGFASADCWIPMESWTQQQLTAPVRGIIGRLRPETPSTKVEAMLTGYARELSASRPAHYRIYRVSVESLDIPVTWTALSYSFPLLIAFALTMVVPCANAANIMLARSSFRQREIGTRLSLGAGRGRVVRQLLTEALLLAALAAAVGLFVARIAIDILAKTIQSTAPQTLTRRFRIPDLALDEHVFVYMFLVAVATTMLFALAPAAQATRVSLSAAMRGGGGEIGGGLPASKLRDVLVVAQVSLCVMLLAASVVLLRGTGEVTDLERGYDGTSVFAALNRSPEDAKALAAILAEERWVHTAAALSRPLVEMNSLPFADPSRIAVAGWRTMYYDSGSSGLLDVVGIPLVRGRRFTQDESENRLPVAIVSELAAAALWPSAGDPIGKTLAMQSAAEMAPNSSPPDIFRPPFREAVVIGVCRDIVVKARDRGVRPAVYFPDKLRRGTTLLVRGTGAPEQTRKHLEAALARAPGSAHGASVVGMQETVDWETYPQRALSWLATLLSGVALLLTVTGIYGVMAYSVSQRSKEIGIRMALGADSFRIARLVLGYTARLAGIGVLAGLALAIGLLQFVASQVELMIHLGDVSAYALSFATAALAALAAAFGPLRRALAVDPQSALRSE